MPEIEFAVPDDARAQLTRTGSAHDPLLTPREAASVLQVSAYTICQRARRGEIPAIRLGKFWRFRRSSLERWLNAQERPAR